MKKYLLALLAAMVPFLGAAACVNLTQNLELGDGETGAHGAEIESLQVFLKASGHLDVSPTGFLGRKTSSGLALLQKKAGLPQTGRLDGATRANIRNGSCASGFGRIGVRALAGRQPEFYQTSSGESFSPRGFLYYKMASVKSPIYPYSFYDFGALTRSQVTFRPEYYRSAEANRDLAEMARLGYNTVRVFDPGMCYQASRLRSGERIDRACADAFVDFLKLARDNGIRVYLTFGMVPLTYDGLIRKSPAPKNVEGFNAYFMHPGVIRAQKQHIGDLLSYIKNSDRDLLQVLFAVDLLNEPFFTSADSNGKPNKPFSLASGFVSPASGGRYDMSSPVDRQKLQDDSTAYWISQVAGRIKEIDPKILVTVDVFTPYVSGRTGYNGLILNSSSVKDVRLPNRLKVIAQSSHVDFLDIHLYPIDVGRPYDLTTDLASAELVKNSAGQISFDGSAVPLRKPFLAGELAVDRIAGATPQSMTSRLARHYCESSRSGFQGWLYFYWSNEPSEIWWLPDDSLGAGQTLKTFMSPSAWPDVCSGL